METMVKTIVMESKTARRAQVIANRTGSVEVGIVKAMMIELLKEKLHNGVAHFKYLKKDNTIREAWGTLQTALVNAKTNGRGRNTDACNVVSYFDIEKGAWRSTRFENIIQVF